ncbi:pseudouridylate synthase 7 homolog isoform X2 [Acropora palmata]|uniref:pseudouridylate synthase 7 homolog isoform X2 n=1 Tax=Acropora palmata TaxID=6131 RepID=UPI003D9FB336
MADEDALQQPECKRPRLTTESTETNLDNVDDCKNFTESDGGNFDVVERKKGEENANKTSSFVLDKNQHVQSEENKETENILAGISTSGRANEYSREDPGALKFASVSDADVGIVEFVSRLPGFHGVLKQRYTDFLVSERDPEGNLVRLTDVSLPQKEKTKQLNLDILSAEDREKIQQVVDDETKSKSVILSPNDDKRNRTLVHRAIRENFSVLDSDTVDVENQKAVRVFHKQDSTGKQRNNRWPQELDNYCWFVLYKENKDTMDAINLLSKLLKIKTGVFGYAGTKDRRAVTTQWISAYRVRAEQLQSLNSSLRNLCLGNFKYCKEPLKLGSLSGNHFVITLRSIVGDHSKIEESLQSLKVNGFINYFGLQRFGTTSVSTHAIGLALLQSKWSEAIDLLLNPRDGESDILTAARQHWKDTKNAKETLQKIPKGKFIESDLLQGLVRHGPSGLVNALQSIPRNTRLMYVHAYQSYVWNFMATKRIKEYGLQPVKGDLIVRSASSVGCAENTDASQAGGIVQFISEPSRSTVTVLTEDHIKSGDFTIQDVVLPLPGYDVNYPENNMKVHYRQIMANDDLDIDNMRRKVKDYALSGAYRKLLQYIHLRHKLKINSARSRLFSVITQCRCREH